MGEPLRADPLHCRQHRRRGQPAKKLPIAKRRRLGWWRHREALSDLRDHLLRRLSTSQKSIAGELDHGRESRGTDDHALVASPAGRREEGQEGVEMTSAAERAGGENPHGP